MTAGVVPVRSTLVALGELDRGRPAAGADRVVVAAWYERKAVVLREIAAESATVAEHDLFAVLADQANAHAARLSAACSVGVFGGGSR